MVKGVNGWMGVGARLTAHVDIVIVFTVIVNVSCGHCSVHSA